MHFDEINAKRASPLCSFEFFPPKSEVGVARLMGTITELARLQPAFVSMTYGAGGTTRAQTQGLVQRIKRETSVEPVPHLTCIGHSRREIDELLGAYAEEGVGNILALGGDPPRGQEGTYDRSNDDFQFAADLVEHIQTYRHESARPEPSFGIGVAGFPEGHPGTPNRLEEMDYLKRKVDAGADFIITQLFFSNVDFHDFRERCALAGINVPILAGILPITSTEGMQRMAGLALGARFPAALQRAVGRCGGNNERVAQVGVHWASEQCRDLLDQGVDGIHFYTLNRAAPTQQILNQLGVSCCTDLRA